MSNSGKHENHFHERVMDLVNHNPYRTLGVYSNASLKEITASKTKLTSYARVGKSISPETDMANLLPALDRTEESVEQAFANLSLPQDKLKHALFWFVNDTAMDDMALRHLIAGNPEKAKEILEKKETWSSLVNLAVLAMIQGDYGTALSLLTRMLRTHKGEHYSKSFVTAVCGDTFQPTEDEVVHLFFDLLVDEDESIFIYSILLSIGVSSDDANYVRDKIATPPANRIKAALNKAQKTDAKDAPSSYASGKTLMESTKGDLKTLKEVYGIDDATYAMTADSLAKQILQHGINYYNCSTDDQYDRIDKALELQQYALDISTNSNTKDRCKKNVDILLNIQSKLPPKVVHQKNRIVNDLLTWYQYKTKTIDDAIQLLKDCAPHLFAIKELIGSTDANYRSLSTRVANTALNDVINAINQTQENNRRRQNTEQIKQALRKGWQAMLYMEKLDLEPAFRCGRFKENKDTLKGIIDQLQGFGIGGTMGSYYLPNTNSFEVFGEPLMDDFDLRDDEEVFYSCRSQSDYEYYLSRYPNGKHQREAYAQKNQFEENKIWSDCKAKDTLEGYREYLAETRLSQHSEEALKAIERIKKEQQNEEAIWETCENKTDYKDYLKAYPNGLHKDEAEKKLRKYEERKNRIIMLSVLLAASIGIALILFL